MALGLAFVTGAGTFLWPWGHLGGSRWRWVSHPRVLQQWLSEALSPWLEQCPHRALPMGSLLPAPEGKGSCWAHTVGC